MASYVMQEVELKTPYIHCYLLSTCCSIRHLDLETHIPDLLQHVDMRAFTQLETLRLRSWRTIACSVNRVDLDLLQVQSLRHLHIENWSPKSLNVAPRCRVYVKWEEPQEWCPQEPLPLYPCCTDPGINLVSVHMDLKVILIANALHVVLECHRGLESLRLAFTKVGSIEAPLHFPAAYLQGLRAPLTVEISTTGGCWLQLNAMTPFSNKLVLNTTGLVHVGILDASGSMLWRSLEGPSASSTGEGPESLWGQLANAIPEVHNVNPEDNGAAHGVFSSCKPYLKHSPPVGLVICAIVALKCVCC